MVEAVAGGRCGSSAILFAVLERVREGMWKAKMELGKLAKNVAWCFGALIINLQRDRSCPSRFQTVRLKILSNALIGIVCKYSNFPFPCPI